MFLTPRRQRGLSADDADTFSDSSPGGATPWNRAASPAAHDCDAYAHTPRLADISSRGSVLQREPRRGVWLGFPFRFGCGAGRFGATGGCAGDSAGKVLHALVGTRTRARRVCPQRL